MNKSDTGWYSLTTTDDVDEARALSHEKPVILFKHSIACGTSHMVEHMLKSDWNDFSMPFFRLDLIRYRSVSNYITEITGVVHHSPQVIVLRNGEVIAHTSHHNISMEWIRRHALNT